MNQDQTISQQDVEHIARLARLKLNDAQRANHAKQLGRILGYIAKLNELNIDEVEPMAHAVELSNVLQADEPTTPLSVEQALANAPQKMDVFFKVPKVLADGSGA